MDDNVKQIHKYVSELKRSREWEGRYMRFDELLKKEKKEGYAEGHAEGLETGRAEGLETGRAVGEADMLKLISKMIEAGEADKVKLLSEDAELLEAMRKKYLV
ncbi:MAG: hypothetical protein IJW18_08780, partial [Lachnospiraceae bacterium]|nr:hypothetical protein [Lachnospiraceae bacterium]